MDDKNVLKEAAEALVNEPVKIEIDVQKRTWLMSLLIRLKLLKGKKTFYIKPVTLGCLINISKELLSIDLQGFDKSKILDSNYKLLETHGETMARIVSIAVVNTREGPSKALVQFFVDNLTATEMLKLVSIVLKQMDVQSFMLSILSMKGTNILQSGGSLKPKEKIAFGKQSVE